MGNLLPFNLPDLVQRYDLSRFVETGTGSGASLGYAAGLYRAEKPLFKKLISCEIEPSLAQHAHERFLLHQRVEIISANSVMFLQMILPEIPVDEPVLFWLDAHFPGADSELRSYGDEVSVSVRLPAEAELITIHELRPHHRDVILMDDARIWLDDEFEEGALPEHVRPFCPSERNIDFVHRLFDQTHTIKVLPQDHGYIVLTPKNDTHP